MTDHPLQQWLDAKKGAGERVLKGDLANAVGCSRSRITQVIHYGSPPSLALAAKFSEVTGIPIDQFVRAKEAAE
jgi:hypothetical protein